MTDINDFEDDFGPSKTQVKKEMHALQDIGKRICELPKKQLAKMPISATMLEAVKEWDRIKKHEARRRHLQYVGKVMRTEDIDAIKEALDLVDPSSEAFNRILHQQEKWRDRLIEDGNKGFDDFCEQFDVNDIQRFRQLIRNAVKEHQQKLDNPDAPAPKGKTAARKLFLFIKEHYPS